ncbi:MazG-like family protein [Priestia megaterium]|uniref:MazG-like family protein n=1 Tax=Priestia megaterium TaxID=1404 RepID=UPI00296ED43F|nr:MazG-like family protein [Priestia megaterium]MEB4861266.1 MazG-like family protein [Priestia megaterium]
MLNFYEFEQWIVNFYKERGWDQTTRFEKLGFLFEEIGEIAKAVRLYEIKKDNPNEKQKEEELIKAEILEELGDLLANLIIFANDFEISLDELTDQHKLKLLKRFKN